jgi:ABC-type multidrug transport system fused ATPase/permease subunit
MLGAPAGSIRLRKWIIEPEAFNPMKEARWLLLHLRPYTARTLCALGLATAAGFVSTIDPLLMRHLIDHSLPTRHLANSLVCVALIASCFIGRSLLTGGGALTGFRVAQDLGQDLKEELLNQMNRLSSDWHERTMLGEKLSRLDTDVGQIAEFGADAVNTVVRVVIFFALNLIIMLKLNVTMALAVLPLFPVFFLVRRRFSPLIQCRAKDTQIGIGKATSRVAEHLGAVAQLHLLGADVSRIGDSIGEWRAVIEAQWKQRRTEIAFSVPVGSCDRFLQVRGWSSVARHCRCFLCLCHSHFRTNVRCDGLVCSIAANACKRTASA